MRQFPDFGQTGELDDWSPSYLFPKLVKWFGTRWDYSRPSRSLSWPSLGSHTPCEAAAVWRGHAARPCGYWWRWSRRLSWSISPGGPMIQEIRMWMTKGRYYSNNNTVSVRGDHTSVSWQWKYFWTSNFLSKLLLYPMIYTLPSKALRWLTPAIEWQLFI